MNYDLILARPTSTRGTARLDIWTVNVTEPVLDGCSVPLQQGTSSSYLPARRPTASPVPSLPPCTRDERDQVFGIRPGLGILCIGLQLPQQPQATKNLGKK